MLIGIDTSPCSLSLRNRSTFCSTTKCHQNKLDLKNVFVQKSFSISSILSIPIMLIGINGRYFPAICRVCFIFRFNPDMRLARQRRLFSGNLPAMFYFSIPLDVRLSCYFPALFMHSALSILHPQFFFRKCTVFIFCIYQLIPCELKRTADLNRSLLIFRHHIGDLRDLLPHNESVFLGHQCKVTLLPI